MSVGGEFSDFISSQCKLGIREAALITVTNTSKALGSVTVDVI